MNLFFLPFFIRFRGGMFRTGEFLMLSKIKAAFEKKKTCCSLLH